MNELIWNVDNLRSVAELVGVALCVFGGAKLKLAYTIIKAVVDGVERYSNERGDGSIKNFIATDAAQKNVLHQLDAIVNSNGYKKSMNVKTH